MMAPRAATLLGMRILAGPSAVAVPEQRATSGGMTPVPSARETAGGAGDLRPPSGQRTLVQLRRSIRYAFW